MVYILELNGEVQAAFSSRTLILESIKITYSKVAHVIEEVMDGYLVLLDKGCDTWIVHVKPIFESPQHL